MLFLLACQAGTSAIPLADKPLEGLEDSASDLDTATADTASDTAEGAQDSSDPAEPPAPATCAAHRAAFPSAPDGLVALYVGGDRARPWTAWCADMAGTPLEYLPVRSAFSHYTAGGATSGSDVRTSYERVRIDPVSLRVDISDQRFSTSRGQLTQGSQEVRSMPLGVAMSCDRRVSGVGSIDLTGTPFLLPADAWRVDGFEADGRADFSAGQQRVDLYGGGYCGWISPGVYAPVNREGGFALTLRYGGYGPLPSADTGRSAVPQAASGSPGTPAITSS
jgi:hypothetical protein